MSAFRMHFDFEYTYVKLNDIHIDIASLYAHFILIYLQGYARNPDANIFIA